MVSIRNHLQAHFSETKEFATRTALYGGVGALAMRFISPLGWKELGVASVLNSAFVTISQKIVGSEDLLKHAAATAVGLALSALTLTYGAPFLAGRMSLIISRQAALQLAFLSALGEMVKVAIPKLYYDRQATPKPPTTKEELEKLSTKDFDYICSHFEDYMKDMPLENQEFVAAFHVRLTENDKMILLFPHSMEEVQKLSLLDLFKIHGHYGAVKSVANRSKAGLNPEVMRALHYRFYQANLPLPEGSTRQSMRLTQRYRTRSNQSVYDIKVTLPVSIEEVSALTENQLSWVYASLRRYGNFSQLPLNVQISLNERFNSDPKECYFSLRPTAENMQDLSKDAISVLHKYYTTHKVSFVNLPMTIKNALNEKFTATLGEDKELEDYWIIPKLESIRTQSAHMWLEYFQNNPEPWNHPYMTRAHQQAFKKLFDDNRLTNDLQVHP